jgi:hypothetical protein
VLRRFSPSVGQVGRPLVFIQLLEGNQQLHSDADIARITISNMIVNIRSYVNINIVLYFWSSLLFSSLSFYSERSVSSKNGYLLS